MGIESSKKEEYLISRIRWQSNLDLQSRKWRKSDWKAGLFLSFKSLKYTDFLFNIRLNIVVLSNVFNSILLFSCSLPLIRIWFVHSQRYLPFQSLYLFSSYSGYQWSIPNRPMIWSHWLNDIRHLLPIFFSSVLLLIYLIVFSLLLTIFFFRLLNTSIRHVCTADRGCILDDVPSLKLDIPESFSTRKKGLNLC